MNSLISFIIPAYNCADTLAETVRSVFEGNFVAGDEVVIVNDASTDNTQDVIEELQATYNGIVAFQHHINKGTAAAGRNTGIDQASNTLIFCLDADNVLAANSVPRLKEYLLQTRADAVAFGELHYFENSVQKVTHKWVFKQEITLADALAGPYWPGPSGNYLVTQESWRRAGRYLESIGGAYDSWAFGIRQLATGSRMLTLPDTFYYHRYGHRSAFIRDASKGNSSLIGLQVLIPFLDLIEDADVEYIFGKEDRYTWFADLEKHPLRVKGNPIGQSGTRLAAQQTVGEWIVRKGRRLLKLLKRTR